MKRLNVEQLLEAAQKRTGLSDFGPSDFMEPLGVLVDGLNEDAGIAQDRFDKLHERLQRLLINRLWFAKDLADHPEILEEELGCPIVISTLPRTGSTKLHRMLAATGDFQSLPFWKVHMPSRIAGEADGGVEQRIAETRAHEKWMYEVSPAILTGHPQFTDEAEEDQWMMEQSFRHPILFGLFESPRYLQWLMQADMKPAFDYFLMQLKYIQWQSPDERSKPWLLKSPTHFGSEHFLQEIFGDMRAIVTHRSPGKCIPSITSTSAAARKLYSDRDSSSQMAGSLIAMFSHSAQQHMQWRDANPQIQVHDVAFSDVTGDEIAAAARIYDFCDIEMSDAAVARMTNWCQDNSREKHGRANYSAEKYDIDEEEIQSAFAAYNERFGAYLG